MPPLPSRTLTKSNAQFQRALKRLPLGVSSTFRYWGDDRTIYVSHGKGGRTWDIDGNNYVDYRLGYGPAILGYADDRVDAGKHAVFVDPKAVLFLLGTQMHYEVNKLQSGFVFNNPNQTSACGCGESVQIKPAAPEAVPAGA